MFGDDTLFEKLVREGDEIEADENKNVDETKLNETDVVRLYQDYRKSMEEPYDVVMKIADELDFDPEDVLYVLKQDGILRAKTMEDLEADKVKEPLDRKASAARWAEDIHPELSPSSKERFVADVDEQEEPQGIKSKIPNYDYDTSDGELAEIYALADNLYPEASDEEKGWLQDVMDEIAQLTSQHERDEELEDTDESKTDEEITIPTENPKEVPVGYDIRGQAIKKGDTVSTSDAHPIQGVVGAVWDDGSVDIEYTSGPGGPLADTFDIKGHGVQKSVDESKTNEEVVTENAEDLLAIADSKLGWAVAAQLKRILENPTKEGIDDGDFNPNALRMIYRFLYRRDDDLSQEVREAIEDWVEEGWGDPDVLGGLEPRGIPNEESDANLDDDELGYEARDADTVSNDPNFENLVEAFRREGAIHDVEVKEDELAPEDDTLKFIPGMTAAEDLVEDLRDSVTAWLTRLSQTYSVSAVEELLSNSDFVSTASEKFGEIVASLGVSEPSEESVESKDVKVDEQLVPHSDDLLFIDKSAFEDTWQVLRTREGSNTATVMFTFVDEETAAEAGAKIADAIGGEYRGKEDPRVDPSAERSPRQTIEKKEVKESYGNVYIKADFEQGLSKDEIIKKIQDRYPDIGDEQAARIWQGAVDGTGGGWEKEEVKEDSSFLARGEIQQLIDAWELIGSQDDDSQVRIMADEKVEELLSLIASAQEPSPNELEDVGPGESKVDEAGILDETEWFISIPEEGDWPIRYSGGDEAEAKQAYLKDAERDSLPEGSKIWHR